MWFSIKHFFCLIAYLKKNAGTIKTNADRDLGLSWGLFFVGISISVEGKNNIS